MKEKNMSYIEETKRILATEGLWGFYWGTCIMILKEFPGCGLFFYFKFFFDRLMNVKDEESFWFRCLKSTLSGGMTGSLAWTIGMPFDALKSFIQTSPEKLKIWDAIKWIYNWSGIRGFYYGLMPTIVRSFPSTAVLFVIYEEMFNLLNNE